MYLTKLTLENMRCYKNVVIDLEKDNKAYSVLFAGNNGRGKSALLRSIAMGLCDNASSGSLLREMQGDFIRKDTDKDERIATIIIELKDQNGTDRCANYKIKTTIKTSKKLGFEVVNQELYRTDIGNEKEYIQEEFPWDRIFVTAYGAGLRTEGTEDYGQYFAADAVYSLFKYSWPMQNPELIWRRLREVARDSQSDETDKNNVEKEVDKNIKECLLDILNLNDANTDNRDKVELENNGIFITSNWGKQELSALGDGYRCLTTMIMDIISWQLLMKNNKVILEEMESHTAGEWEPLGAINECSGIVIIDEIERHLHPKLQRIIIKKLKNVFPKIQFIVSSHSPLCVAGTADVENEFKVYRTRSENGNNCAESWTGSLAGLRTDQILEHFFDVPYINESTLNDMEEYSQLYLLGKSGRKDQEENFQNLAKKLSETAQSNLLELKSKLLDEIVRKQSEIIEKKIAEQNND